MKDYKSLRALNAFSVLLIGINMLPQYGHIEHKDFIDMISKMEDEDLIAVLTFGAKTIELDPKEVRALVGFCTDKNGVPYCEENIKNLGPAELVEVIVTVCMEIAKNIEIDLVTEDEKKNLEISPLM